MILAASTITIIGRKNLVLQGREKGKGSKNRIFFYFLHFLIFSTHGDWSASEFSLDKKNPGFFKETRILVLTTSHVLIERSASKYICKYLTISIDE
jgi:hypothetical protein